MTRPVQHGAAISRMGLRATKNALALVAALLPLLFAVQSAQAQTLSVLYNFTGKLDGGFAYQGLIQGPSGNFFGTTSFGGMFGLGTVFQVNRTGTETVLYSFTGGTDGGQPYSSLVRDTLGNLYGTTSNGGAHGVGTVFQVTPAGTETVLYSFGYVDGANPSGGLIRDAQGNLYGTTLHGGSAGLGTVFKLDTTGTETVLHNFAGGAADGASPYFTRLHMDKAGNLYGTTQKGGAANIGIVFELSSSGTFTLLHSFAGGPTDGSYPSGSIMRDAAGNLRGTTQYGGPANLGTVFVLSTTGTLTLLHSFAGGSTDGAFPYGGLVQDIAGNLYGTTTGGGARVGTIYKLTKDGTFTLLHSLLYLKEGAYPYGGLVVDAKGNLFGTALQGGSGHYGTVFKLAP